MEFVKKFSILKCFIVCLLCIAANKADDWLYRTDSRIGTINSEIRIPEANLISIENYSFSSPETQCRVPRQSNFTSTLRTFSQAQRNSSSNHSRHGFVLTKSGKSMNEYTTSLFFISILNFPSGLNEANHHLISLRKLII